MVMYMIYKFDVYNMKSIAKHIKAYQSISKHIKAYQSISKHIKAYQSIMIWPFSLPLGTYFSLFSPAGLLANCTPNGFDPNPAARGAPARPCRGRCTPCHAVAQPPREGLFLPSWKANQNWQHSFLLFFQQKSSKFLVPPKKLKNWDQHSSISTASDNPKPRVELFGLPAASGFKTSRAPLTLRNPVARWNHSATLDLRTASSGGQKRLSW